MNPNKSKRKSFEHSFILIFSPSTSQHSISDFSNPRNLKKRSQTMIMLMSMLDLDDVDFFLNLT